MKTRTCEHCKAEKKITEFAWRIKGKVRHAACKVCTRQRSKAHYLRNKSYYVAKAKKRRAALRDELYEKVYQYLLGHPCLDCGSTDVLVLEFDHRSDKEDNISTMLSRLEKWEMVQAEIAKCDVRCRNCHSRKTAREFNTWMYRRTSVPVA